MSALARYFHANNKAVAGYDRVRSSNTVALEELGISICYDEQVSAIEAAFMSDGQTLVIYTPAVPKDHLQLTFFQKEGFEVLKRSEVLGLITKNTFCFAEVIFRNLNTGIIIRSIRMYETGYPFTHAIIYIFNDLIYIQQMG